MAALQEVSACAYGDGDVHNTATAAQEADFSVFEDLQVDHGALDMARELVG